GSVQPYGLVVPASFARNPEKVSVERQPGEHRLDIWLHGRDDHLTELKFISDRQRSYGEFAPTNAFVLHPYGRYCNAFKFAGEMDKQKAAADAMAAAMKSNGMELLHLIGPRTEHKYEPETKKELARRVDELVARGRNPMPRRVRSATWSLRYNEMFWLTLEGL